MAKIINGHNNLLMENSNLPECYTSIDFSVGMVLQCFLQNRENKITEGNIYVIYCIGTSIMRLPIM